MTDPLDLPSVLPDAGQQSAASVLDPRPSRLSTSRNQRPRLSTSRNQRLALGRKRLANLWDTAVHDTETVITLARGNMLSSAACCPALEAGLESTAWPILAPVAMRRLRVTKAERTPATVEMAVSE